MTENSNNLLKYQICNRCIMDTTAADINFNEDGICNYCEDFVNLKRVFNLQKEKKKIN